MVIAQFPSAIQLRECPDKIKEEIKRIAIAALRRLFYPIAQLYVARQHRQKVIRTFVECNTQKSLDVKVISTIQQASVISSCVDADGLRDNETTQIAEAVRLVLPSVTYGAFLQQEIMQFTGEPSKCVVVLLSGVIKRVASLKGGDKSQSIRSNNSRRSSLGSTKQADSINVASRQSSALGGTRHGSFNGLLGYTPTFFSQGAPLHAPTTLNELSLLGGYTCVDTFVAESSLVFVARIPKDALCDIMNAFPRNVQRRMLHKSLSEREGQLKRHSPMTCGRMRICPLLNGLSDDNIMHLMDYLVPRVYPAGMRIGECGGLSHIYFIRRGVVHLQHDETFMADISGPTQPKSRSLLLEGHTFGERQCIFREALGDNFYTLTNVDVYMLPFSVLIQFMKQQPDSRSSIYATAKASSFLLEKEYDGMRFLPSSLENMGTVILSTAGSVAINKWFQRRVSISTTKPPIMNRHVTFDALAKGSTHESSEGLRNGSVAGVSPHFLEKIHKIPLLGLCSVDDLFFMECAGRWRLLTYDPGEYVIHAGDECNRLLLFNGGGAVILKDENSAHKGGNDSPLHYMHAPRVPPGCIIGYTCVRRHSWQHSIVALESQIEVWELKRQVFAELLRKYHLDRQMQSLVLQILQPLVHQNDRSVALDYQPLLAPSPNSLWSEQRIPNMHPVNISETVRFPVWKEGAPPVDTTYQKQRQLRRQSALSMELLTGHSNAPTSPACNSPLLFKA